MRVLFAAKHIPGGSLRFGGVQSWIQTVADVLERRGHSSEFWEPSLPLPDVQFDLGVFAHRSVTYPAIPLCRRSVAVTHGVIDAERPQGDLFTLFTSEEVADYWKQPGPVLAQPIDLTYWTPDHSARCELVFYSYRSPTSLGLSLIADKLGIKFRWLRNVDHKTARAVLSRATIAFASGRAALEAMACGAPTVILDHRPYNGRPLLCADIDVARRHNYSGRGGIALKDADVMAAIQTALDAPHLPETYVRRWHDAEHVVDMLLRHSSQC